MGDTGRATGSHLDWRMEIRGIQNRSYLLIKNKQSFFLYKFFSIFCVSRTIVQDFLYP